MRSKTELRVWKLFYDFWMEFSRIFNQLILHFYLPIIITIFRE